MPNSKQKETKRKQRKRKERQKANIILERQNAKKKNKGTWILSGTYPNTP